MVKGTILIASTTLSGKKLISLTQRTDTTVIYCDTSRDALEYLIENTPEFVVLEQSLESVPGLEIIRKIRKIKRLHKIPVALLNFEEKLNLTPPDRKLINVFIEERLSESELLASIQDFAEETMSVKKTGMDLKSTMFLEQAISQLHTDDDTSRPSENMSKAQEMMMSPTQKIQYLQEEVKRLNVMIAEYQERFGDIYEHKSEKNAWLDVLLKPVF